MRTTSAITYWLDQSFDLTFWIVIGLVYGLLIGSVITIIAFA